MNTWFGSAGPWTGFYTGLNAGYGFGRSTVATTGQVTANANTVADGARAPFVRMERDGFIGGAQAGYNWQNDALVFGFETDIQYSDLRDNRNVVTTGTLFPGTRNNVFRQNLNYLGTARGRIGHAWDNTLVYATGGLAYGRTNNSADFSGPAPASVPQFTGSTRETRAGYTVGGGVEFAYDANWSIKTEYLYYDLGSNTVAANVIAGSGGAGTGYNLNFNNMGHVVRFGINYKFN